MNLSRQKFLRSLVVLAGITGVATCASADVINFENYSGPSLFGAPGQTLVINGTSSGTLTISGGTILTAEANLPADQTSVYGTCAVSLCGVPSYSLITFKFTSTITNFFFNLYNGQTHSDVFTIFDNAGNSMSTTIAPNLSSGLSLVSFPAVGSMVTISTTDTAYDFSIDNVGFNQATPGTVTPEPNSLLLLGTGIAGLGAFARRRIFAALRTVQ